MTRTSTPCPGSPRVLATVFAVTALAAGAACSPLPDSGPVEVGSSAAPSASTAPFDFNPPSPVQGADREEVVVGFLRALQATPVGTSVAEEFLTTEAAASWRPQQRTIVYSGNTVLPSAGGPADVAVQLDASFELDRTGRWVDPGSSGTAGVAADEADRSLRFRLARQDDEWRIAALPDAMVIPETHFEARYREYYLPFFDATGSILVPELVYLPWGVQAPTRLVQGLLSGPSDAGRAVERTFFPPSIRMGVGVPVREDGVAEVPLSRQFTELGKEQLEPALAQLAWTLGQVGEINRFRVTVDGTPIELPGGRSTVDVDDYPEHDPAVVSASTDLFGLRGDTVVQLVGDSEIAAAVLPRELRRSRSLGVDLAGQQFALVSPAGDRVVVLPRATDETVRPTTAYRGTDLLRPMWDHTGRLLVLDRTPQGPSLVVHHFGRSRRIPAQGLAGERLLAAALSRDGTRLVAALAGTGGSGDRLVMMRVVRQASGVPVRLTPPQQVPTAQPLVRVQDVGWRDPTTVAVLTRPARTTSEVVLASADGSSGDLLLDSTLDVLFEPGVSLAASPATPVTLLVAARDGGLHALEVQGRWDLDAVPSGLRLPSFVG
jgi:hypothetical protein